ncbi:MAG TPA: LysM domain-containing protein [Casimicrobiaceae bacterium]|nr:LysM domain-containing protein [Casimicrobiaceae bacterium]
MALSPYARFGASALVGTPQTERHHVVTGGETLPLIAAYEYNTFQYDSEIWRQLAEANGIDDLDALAVNTVLVVPPIKPSST